MHDRCKSQSADAIPDQHVPAANRLGSERLLHFEDSGQLGFGFEATSAAGGCFAETEQFVRHHFPPPNSRGSTRSEGSPRSADTIERPDAARIDRRELRVSPNRILNRLCLRLTHVAKKIGSGVVNVARAVLARVRGQFAIEI